jgi:hypothetical protein
LAEKIALDQRISLNIQKGRDQSVKRGHSTDFLHEFATLNEQQFERLWGDVQRLSKILAQLNSDDEVFLFFFYFIKSIPIIIFFKGLHFYFKKRISCAYSTIWSNFWSCSQSSLYFEWGYWSKIKILKRFLKCFYFRNYEIVLLTSVRRYLVNLMLIPLKKQKKNKI